VAGARGAGARQEGHVEPKVELEEDIYSYRGAENGSDPMWCRGSTCIVRVGGRVFVSGEETVPGAAPLNNVRWLLFLRDQRSWEVVARGTGRTREPCPLACFSDGSLYLSDNPTLAPGQYCGPARPEVLALSSERPREPYQTLLPVWGDEPDFTEHSYRNFAADGQRRELVLFQNVGDTHAAWSFRDSEGRWSAHGQLRWPWGADYPRPQPIRLCFPPLALEKGAVYFCGVSDIVEPYPQWRRYKRETTGRDWDYDFRRLFFTWSDDVTTGRFHTWVEISSRDRTCGRLLPCDLWVAPEGAIHLLWTERALDERLREVFFPGETQSWALMHAVFRNGSLESKRALVSATGSGPGPRVGDARFHVTADGRLFVFYYVWGTEADGAPVSENRLLEILPAGRHSNPVKVDLQQPFIRFHTATRRAGCTPSEVLDLYGISDGTHGTARYARIRIG
jgi:hypothetical protein